jgi:hypothetical protein
MKHGLALLLALVVSGAPAALQMCGSHCVAPVSCHDSSPAGAQSVVKTGPQMCPHTAALGALVGGKPVLPAKAITQVLADVGSPALNAPPAGIRTSVRFSNPHHEFVVRSQDLKQLRI